MNQLIFPINGLGEWAFFLKMAGLPRRPLNLARPISAWQGPNEVFLFFPKTLPPSLRGGIRVFFGRRAPVFLKALSLFFHEPLEHGRNASPLHLAPPLAPFAAVAFAAAVFFSLP